MEHLEIILKGYLILVIIQSILWLIQLKTKDASTADVGWSVGMTILVAWYAMNIEGFFLRKLLALSLVSFWTLRLSTHLIKRIILDGQEDSRYAQFRAQWKEDAQRNFFFIFQFQPIFNIILSIPFLIIMSNSNASITILEIVACIIWLIGFSGEAAADKQLKRFRDNLDNKGKICQEGLWNYSRHPNFFFEWVMWVSYYIFASASPNGLWAIISPLFMLFLLLKVTGIPIMEQRALKNKGKIFADYMKTTSFFVPLPKKVKGW